MRRALGLELIEARGLITALTTPAFLVDSDARLLFFNAAAGEMLETSFEQRGQMPADEWTGAFGPLDDSGEPIPLAELPLAMTLAEGRPAHGTYRIRTAVGAARRVESSSVPILGRDGAFTGALVFFWMEDDAG